MAQAEAQWEAVKARDNVGKGDVRTAQNRQRVGADHRKGADVTAQMFEDAFGFRGVQFGNWVAQGAGAKDRQGLLNEAYDALMDLSLLLGVPSRAMSLDGSLGLSLGARGSGKAAAHFEHDSLVINLTKTKGAGSLAHEWFHALDNYFRRQRGGMDKQAGREDAYITYKPEAAWVPKAGTRRAAAPLTSGQLRQWLQARGMYDSGKSLEENAQAANFERDPQHKDGVRPQVEAAFAQLVQALNDSPMAARATVLDGGAAKGYWGRIIERGARSFENYVINKMALQGYSNDFLANIRSFDEWQALGKNTERYPYLTPAEEGPVVEAFDNLFGTIETRHGDDGNVAMFSRSDAKPVTNPTAVKLRRAMVQRTVDALAKGWAKAPNVTVVDSMQDERVPEAVRKADAAQRSQGAMGEPEGFWYQGQVYLVASALPTSADAARVLYHEVLGHHGLRGHFGKDLDRVLDQVIKLRRKDVQAKAQEYGLDMSNPEHAGYAAEEVLAELAQSRPDLGFVQRAIAAIRNFLRTHVPGFKVLELTDADIVQGYLLPARGWVERGADAGSAADGSMFSRSGGPDTEAQRQFKAMERTYGGKAAYDRAKAAGKTKLTYGQWVQVRTPNFKAWFGDWEAVRAQERLDAMEPVQVRVPDAWRGLGHAELRQKMAEELDRMVREKTQIEHPELGIIQVGRAGAKKTSGSARDPAKSLVAADIEALIPASIYARTEPSRGGDGPDIEGYSTLLARVDVDGVPLVASFTVRHQSDGQWYYNAVALHDGKEKAQDSYGRPDQQAGSRFAPIAGLSDFIRRPLARVNPEAVSKVVDSATGEPLVVYHGTNADFSVFRDGVAYFTPRTDYSYIRNSDNNMPVFLAIKNPYRPNSQSEIERIRSFPERVEELIAQGYDGMIWAQKDNIMRGASGWGNDLPQIVAFKPTQIKSATGNSGQFDPTNPDIRFSRSAAPSLSEVAETGRDTAWTGPAASKWDDFIYKMQDKHIDTKRALEAVRATQQKILI